MGYQTKNYRKQGGDVDNIGGTLNLLVGSTTNMDGDLKRGGVSVRDSLVCAKFVTVTIAELNAGKTLIAAQAGKKIQIVGFWMAVTGAYAALTDFRVSDNADSPVDVLTIAQANLTNGAEFGNVISTGYTKGAGWGVPLTAGKAVVARKTGSTATTGTSMLIMLQYTVVDA